MPNSIGEAQVSIEVALEMLDKSLKEASQRVDDSVNRMKKEIVLNIDTNVSSKVQNSFNQISNVMNKVDEEAKIVVQQISETTDIMASSLDDVAASVIGTGSSFTGLEAVLGGIIGSGGVFGLVLLGAGLLIGEFIALSKFIYDIGEQVSTYISQNEELSDAFNKVAGVAKYVWESLKDIYEMVKDKIALAIFDFIKNLKETWDEMNKTTGAGDNLLGSLQKLMKTGFDAVGRVLDSVMRLFKSFTGTTDDSKDKVEGLTTVLNTIAGVFNLVAFVVGRVASGFELLSGWAEKVGNALRPVRDLLSDISKAVAGIPAFILGRIFDGGSNVPDTTGGLVNNPQLPPNTNPNAYPEGTLPDKNDRAIFLNRQKSKGGSKGSSTKEDPFKEETENLEELIRLQELHLNQLEREVNDGKASLLNKRELLATFIEELEQMQAMVGKAENLQKIEDQIDKIKTNQSDTNKRILTDQQQIEQTAIRLLQKADQETKERFEKNKEAEAQLNNLKLLNTGNLHNIEIYNINEKYRKKIDAINKEKIAEELKVAIIKQLEIAKVNEITALNKQGTTNITDFMKSSFLSVINWTSINFKNVFQEIFGSIGRMFEQLFQKINAKLLELATNAVFKWIINILSGGSTGGFFGFLGSLFGRGGYTGDGPEDEAAGIVHRREFVVNQMGTSSPGNRALLEAMNRGEDVLSLLKQAKGEQVDYGFMRSVALNTSTGAGNTININTGGVNVKATIKKLTGLSENDWSELVDNEMIPQISKGLKRAGKEVLDNTIN